MHPVLAVDRGAGGRASELFWSRKLVMSEKFDLWRRSKFAAGLLAGLLVGAGMMVGTIYSLNQANRTSQQSPWVPETLLHASASHSGESMAMATGMVDDMEGLFVLDYLTGELQCFVPYPMNGGKIGGVFKYNVVSDLGVEQGKKPNYIMVTGMAQFQRGAGINTPANCAVYVADANTGKFAVYSFLWNRTQARSGLPQTGPFVLLDVGKARNLEIRE